MNLKETKKAQYEYGKKITSLANQFIYFSNFGLNSQLIEKDGKDLFKCGTDIEMFYFIETETLKMKLINTKFGKSWVITNGIGDDEITLGYLTTKQVMVTVDGIAVVKINDKVVELKNKMLDAGYDFKPVVEKIKQNDALYFNLW